MTTFNKPDETSVWLSGFIGDSIVDGPGLRCTVFTQGCPHHCYGCHNSATWPLEGGTKTTITELEQRIAQYPLCKGVTFSGGEPFIQAEPLANLAKILKQKGYEIAVYTGYTFEELQKGTLAQAKLLKYTDTLIDGPFIQAQKNLNLLFKGSENQRILNIPESLEAGHAVVETNARWVRKKNR